MPGNRSGEEDKQPYGSLDGNSGFLITREGTKGGLAQALGGHSPSVPGFFILCMGLKSEEGQRDSLSVRSGTEDPLSMVEEPHSMGVHIYVCSCQPLLPIYFLKIYKI